MKIESPVFQDNEMIPARYTCDGEDVSPPLMFSGVPDGTRSLVMIVDDPDAPAGTWVHWTLWNIPPETRSITEDSVPPGAVQGITSFGKSGWGGPCPPSGRHHYYFKLYALDIEVELPPTCMAHDLHHAMEGHILCQAQLIGLYRRSA